MIVWILTLPWLCPGNRSHQCNQGVERWRQGILESNASHHYNGACIAITSSLNEQCIMRLEGFWGEWYLMHNVHIRAFHVQHLHHWANAMFVTAFSFMNTGARARIKGAREKDRMHYSTNTTMPKNAVLPKAVKLVQLIDVKTMFWQECKLVFRRIFLTCPC